MAIGAMNSLFFARDVPFVEPFSSIAELPKGQRECIQEIVQSVLSFGPPPPSASRQEALVALRASPCGYEEPSMGVGEVVSLVLEQLSLPTGRVAGVDLEKSLDEPLKEMVCIL
jgi:hypothetical protein